MSGQQSASRLGEPSAEVSNHLRIALALTPLFYLFPVSLWVGFDSLVWRLANDDQAYYIVVARNLFTQGPTYDGIYLTNGVHPLYAVLLGLIYRLPLTWTQLAPASVILCVLCGCAFLYVALGIRPVRRSTAVVVALVMSSLGVYPILYRGMEGALALLLIAVYLARVSSRSLEVPQLSKPPAPASLEPSTAHLRADTWALVELTGLSIALWAARLELLAFPPVAIAIASRAQKLTPLLRRHLLMAWCLSLVAFGGYSFASYYWIGLALPVSGLLKQNNWYVLWHFAVLGVALGGASCVLTWSPRFRGLAARAWMTHGLLTFSALFYLVHISGQPDIQTQTWYYFPLPGLVALGLVELDRAFSRSFRLTLLLVLAGAGFAVTVWECLFVVPLRADAFRAKGSIVEHAKQVALPGERFMLPGWLVLHVGPEFQPFSHDGLVGGSAQYQAIQDGQLLEFAYQSGVRFISATAIAPGLVNPPWVPPGFELKLVSSGLIPSGRSLWYTLKGKEPCSGLCGVNLAIYRIATE